jgi:hypothetical protein
MLDEMAIKEQESATERQKREGAMEGRYKVPVGMISLQCWDWLDMLVR